MSRILGSLALKLNFTGIIIYLQSPAPAPYVKEMNDAGQFYTNRVLKDSKDSRASKDLQASSQCHVDWTKAWVSALANLHALVKQYHTTGLVWNPKGGDAKTVSSKWRQSYQI